MILEQGEKVHIIVRRRFEDDLRRHFIGEVVDVDTTVARLKGNTFVLDTTSNQYIRRPDMRIRIIGLSDSGSIINVLPVNADLEQAKYTQNAENRLVVTDGKTFSLDINEFGTSY